MDRDFIRELVKQVIDDMANDEETIATEINSTADVAGFDGPLSTKKVKRKASYDDDDDDDE